MKLIRKNSEELVYIMFNKPAGYITARSDNKHKTIFDILPQSLKDSYTLFPVGRLDKDTEGILLLTNDGKFCDNIIHSKNEVKKVYEFWALGTLSQESINKITNGFCLNDNYKDNIKPTKPAKIEILRSGKYCDLKDIIELLPSKKISLQKDNQDVFKGQITLLEGRKHEVKRIIKQSGAFVFYLKRIRIGNLSLDKNLSSGEYRFLTRKEIATITS